MNKAIVAIIAIVIIAIMSVLLLTNHHSASLQNARVHVIANGTMDAPYNITGYVNPGYYKYANGTVIYISNYGEWMSSLNPSYVNTTKKNTQLALARYSADIAKQESTNDIIIAYQGVIPPSVLELGSGAMVLYKLGMNYRISLVSSLSNTNNFEDYVQVLSNGTGYECTPGNVSPDCSTFSAGQFFSVSVPGFVLSNYEPLDFQLSSLEAVASQPDGNFAYLTNESVAGSLCDLFRIQNSTENYTICLDQNTGFPLVDNFTIINTNAGGSVYASIVAKNILYNASASDFYPQPPS